MFKIFKRDKNKYKEDVWKEVIDNGRPLTISQETFHEDVNKLAEHYKAKVYLHDEVETKNFNDWLKLYSNIKKDFYHSMTGIRGNIEPRHTFLKWLKIVEKGRIIRSVDPLWLDNIREQPIKELDILWWERFNDPLNITSKDVDTWYDPYK